MKCLTFKQRLLYKTAMLTMGVFTIAHSVIYPMGIGYSAHQAVLDGRNGTLPTIGGHSIEWTAEWFAVVNATWYIAGELTNISWANRVAKIYKEKIGNITKDNGWCSRANRLKEVMENQIQRIPIGSIFPKRLSEMFSSPKITEV